MSCSAQQRRINHLVSVLSPNDTEASKPTPQPTSSQSDDDIVLVSPVRTPITKAKRGGLKDTHPIDLLVTVLRAVLERSGVPPQEIGDVVIGNVLLKGSGASPFRMASLAAGIPESVPLTTVNRQCSSGLQAFASVAGAIRAGYYDIGIAGGVESMSFSPDMNSVEDLPDSVLESEKAIECLVTMGQTSENVAEQYGISREAQDQFAYNSQVRADAAQKQGRFDAEIVPVHTKVLDKDGKATPVVISKDDGIRVSNLEGLAKLRPAFSPTGASTAGNSSQVSDGAAAVLVMKRSAAKRLNLKPVARFVSYAVVGVPPAIMGVGPAFAIPAALEKAGLKKEQIDVFEINEAFASQALYCVEKLGLDKAKVNPNGGAIALGHPLGCTGARQIATLVHELKRTNGKYGVISMCIGTGMGAAGVFQLE